MRSSLASLRNTGRFCVLCCPRRFVSGTKTRSPGLPEESWRLSSPLPGSKVQSQQGGISPGRSLG